MNREHKSEVPLEEFHKHSLRFNDISVWWALRRVLWNPLIISLDIINENKMVVYLIIFWGYQEARGEQYSHSPGGQQCWPLNGLDRSVQEVSIHQFDSDVGGFNPLSKFLPHLEKTIHQNSSLIAIYLCNFVLFKVEVLLLDIVVHFVPCFILEHLSQKLWWWNISVKLLRFVFNRTALILKSKTNKIRHLDF